MRILVWQWGRRGAGPRFAAELAGAFDRLPGQTGLLSLSAQCELLAAAAPPRCALPYGTYAGFGQFLARLPFAPLAVTPLVARLRPLAPEVALCAMPAPLDFLMAAALRRLGVPFLVVVHDAEVHPGDKLPLQMLLQRRLVRAADGIVALSGHVAGRLRALGLVGARPLLMANHPPFAFGAPPPPPRAHGGPLRLLSFGRMLPYKGLDLLAAALQRLGPQPGMAVRVVGSGPPSAALAALQQIPGVVVENRWVPEDEVGALLAWADAVVLSHTEASQSGVAAAALAARRWVVGTRVGGLTEQLGGEPLARLCDPTPDSLAAALRLLLTDPPPPPLPIDTAAAWQKTAAELVEGMTAVLAQRPAGRR